MKRLFALMLTLALAASLAACAGRPPEVPEVSDAPDASDASNASDTPDVPEKPIEAPRFTREEFPRLDGSTSTAPLAIAMASLMLGESEEDVTPLISFSRTTNSYYNLLNGDADLLIVSEGNEEVYAERESLGFAWEQTPFAMDAFVFVVNEKNPVDSITVEEARRIYSGEITNWSELGGEDLPIIALQRNPEAGSQSLMEKLVMKGTPMMEAPREYVAESMGGLMEAVRGYDSSAGAIGYSVYYYAEEMRAAEGLKLLKIDGVDPEPDAIRSGAYPLTNPYYTVLPASAPEGSPARRIRDWLLGEDGQRLAAEKGYVSVMDIPTTPKETLPVVGTRLFEEYTDTLIPGDYGTLIPYAGIRVTASEFAVSGCLYGLMTADGAVAVDPVYADVSVCGDVLVLTRAENGERRIAVAARSGEWCTDFMYIAASVSDEGAVLYQEDRLTLMRRTGEKAGTYSAGDLGITDEQLQNMRRGPLESGVGEWLSGKLSVVSSPDTVTYLDMADGTLKETDTETWYSFYPSEEPETPAVEGAWFLYDSALGRDAPALLELSEPGENGAGIRTYYLEDGTPLPGLTLGGFNPYQSVRLVNGLIERLDANTATYYDMNTMRVVFRTYLGFDAD